MNITYHLPIRTYSALNQRLHWAARARCAKAERTAARYGTPAGIRLPVVVTLTRIAPRMLDDDNCVGALKACRDGIADRLGVDDRSELVTWRYRQRRGAPRQYAVDVEIAARMPNAEIQPQPREARMSAGISCYVADKTEDRNDDG